MTGCPIHICDVTQSQKAPIKSFLSCSYIPILTESLQDLDIHIETFILKQKMKYSVCHMEMMFRLDII